MKINRLRNFLLPLMSLIMIIGMSAARPAAAAIIDDADQGGHPFSTVFTGPAEVPGPGDPDGSGTAFITLNQGQGKVCWELTAANIAPATAAHIHRGVAGPVVVPLSPPTGGASSGCASADRALIKEIRQNPENFYVNVHNAEFPAGAMRGQLGK